MVTMWKDEKADYLRRNRNYASLLDGDEAEAHTPRSQSRGKTQDRQFVAEDGSASPERKAYLDRRSKLKELERQKLTKGKNGLHASSSSSSRGAAVSTTKASEPSRNGGSSRSAVDLSFSREKKKLPDRRSFGSFFGPSEPVVAKRIIDEAREREREREKAKTVAAEEAIARAKAERKKLAASLPAAGKGRHDPRPPLRPPKPVDKSTEKTRKLKEARDYSFLFDDSPLPPPKAQASRDGRAPSNQGEARRDASNQGQARRDASNQGEARRDAAGSVRANNHSVSRQAPSERVKSTAGSAAGYEGSTKSSTTRPLQSQPTFSRPARSSATTQGDQDSRILDRSVSRQNTAVVVRSSSSTAKVSNGNKVSAAGPGRPEQPRKSKDLREAAMLREVVAGSTTSTRNKSIAASPALDRRNSQIANGQSSSSFQATARHPPPQPEARRPPPQTDRPPSRATERQPARAPERQPARAPERQPARAPERQPARAPERQPARAPDRRPAQSTGRLPPQGKDAQSLMAAKASTRGPVVSQGLKKAAPTNAPARREAGHDDPRRQGLTFSSQQQKPSSKGPSRPALSDYNRARHTQEPRRAEAGQKRARSSSEESEERPVRRTRLPDLRKNSVRLTGRRGRSSSEEDGDSFIDDDDDDDPGSVASKIHRIMGYNPHKYRGNDDFDDRSMEVGFRAIQAEERRSAREARLEDERELELIEAEEREERLRKAKKKRERRDR